MKNNDKFINDKFIAINDNQSSPLTISSLL